MNILFSITALLTVFCTSVLLVYFLAIQTRIAQVVSLYLFSFANIILTITITGLLRMVNAPLITLSIHLMILLCVLFAWHRKLSRKTNTLKTFFQELGKNFKSLFKFKELIPLLIVLLLSLIFQFILITIIPPNSHDSLTTHLSRVGYWYQNNSYFPFSVHNIRDVYYPVNPAFQALWTIVLAGTDTWVEISQFIAMFVCALSVYGISIFLKRSRKSALFNSLLFLSYPIVLMQGTTAQTDMIVAALIASAFYFLIFAYKQSQQKFLILSALALALALGSKQTAFFILPGYVTLFFLLCIKTKSPKKKILKTLLLSFAIFFILFGSLTYITNIIYFGSFFGPPGIVNEQTGVINITSIFEKFGLNSLRFFYNAIDPSGIPSPLKNYFIKAKAYSFSPLLGSLGIDLESDKYLQVGHSFAYLTIPHLSEDEAWFGVVGFFLMTIAIVKSFVRGIKERKPTELGLVATFIIYAVCIIFSRPGWDAYQGRYFLSVAVLTTPLIDIFTKNTSFTKIVRSTLMILMILIIATTHLLNEGKPAAVFDNNPSLIRESIWEMDRIDRITIQNKQLRYILRKVKEIVPPNARVGLLIDTGIWDYPFFLENFSQKLIPIAPKELALNEEWVRANGIEYILMNTSQTLWDDNPSFTKIQLVIDDWFIFSIREPQAD